MIKPRCYYTNPWRDHARQDGIQRGRQDWSDLQDLQDADSLDAARGIINALILGFAVWGVLGIVAALALGWLK